MLSRENIVFIRADVDADWATWLAENITEAVIITGNSCEHPVAILDLASPDEPISFFGQFKRTIMNHQKLIFIFNTIDDATLFRLAFAEEVL